MVNKKADLIFLAIEFGAIATIGIIQELIRGQIGSLVVSIFALVFLVFSLLELFDSGKNNS